jgi:hypothetical protein
MEMTMMNNAPINVRLYMPSTTLATQAWIDEGRRRISQIDLEESADALAEIFRDFWYTIRQAGGGTFVLPSGYHVKAVVAPQADRPESREDIRRIASRAIAEAVEEALGRLRELEARIA